MSQNILLFLVWCIIFPAPLHGETIGTWTKQVKESPMDGTVTYYFGSKVYPLEKITMGLTALLMVELKNKREKSYIIFTNKYGVNVNTGLEGGIIFNSGYTEYHFRAKWTRNVFRIPYSEITTHSMGWNILRDDDALTLNNYEQWVGDLCKNNKLLIELEWDDHGTIHFEWDVSGFREITKEFDLCER